MPAVQEVIVRGNDCRKLLLNFSIAVGSLLLCPLPGHSQDAPKPAPTTPPPAEPIADVRALAEAIRELQGQVQALHSQLNDLRAEEQQGRLEAHELRRELRLARSQSPSPVGIAYEASAPSLTPAPASSVPPNAATPNSDSPVAATPEQSSAQRVGKLEEDQQLAEAKLNDQYQTKVESGSKYRLRLSGIVLLNMFSTRGKVDNLDFPGVALERQPFDSASTFGGSLRQSQIGVQVFGPEIAGAHTSADVNFDFAGGFPSTPNGVSTGLVRLRTGTVRLDWADTSIVGGQDHLFFAPLAPTSLASLAVPALSYSGNLWSWTPQVRVEHRLHLTEDSSLLFQGGILDSFSGELPATEYYFSPGAGEKSGQPAYASRVAWSHHIFGQEMIAGFGGYYARQNWGFGRNVDGWTGTTDLTLPFGHLFELTGEFYRGRAVGGLGGGIDRSVLLSGPLTDPASIVQGLNSMGGWTQLKFRPKPKFEVNGAFGHDNPFGNQLAQFTSNPAYYDSLFARNQTWFTNFIYQPRSDVLLSLEFRRLRTFGTNGGADVANHVNFSLGYLF
jgi:hypothetical protein